MSRIKQFVHKEALKVKAIKVTKILDGKFEYEFVFLQDRCSNSYHLSYILRVVVNLIRKLIANFVDRLTIYLNSFSAHGKFDNPKRVYVIKSKNNGSKIYVLFHCEWCFRTTCLSLHSTKSILCWSLSALIFV